MSDAGTSSSCSTNSRSRPQRYTPAEVCAILNEADSEEVFSASGDEDEYVPSVQSETEASDAEPETNLEIEQEDPTDSDDSEEDEPSEEFLAKDGTRWSPNPTPHVKTVNRNIMRQRGGAANFSILYSAKQVFKSLMSPEMCDIIIRETNRKARKVTEAYNNKLVEKYPDVSKRPKPKTTLPFTTEELDAFFGILIMCGLHRSNKEHLSELWKSDYLPLMRASMSRDRFKLLLRFIRFDNDITRPERSRSDKAAAIRDMWIMLNSNLEKGYKPYECLTVDEQLFGYRGRTRFTQYMPSKPEKYGIKIFWACDAKNSYPLRGQIYTGKPSSNERQVNVGERTVLDLVSSYKNSGKNVTTDNFFTSLQLGHILSTWNMTLVGTVRKNKRFLPPSMQPSRNRLVYSTNFAFSKEATLCSYVPKKKKAVVMLSTMHMTPVVENTETSKPEIITYYNKTKGGVDNMNKLLGEYTCKRRTCRWPLAFFYNCIDVAALAAYIIYMEHNPMFRATDRRRKFLRDLSTQLCMPNIEVRMTNPIVTGKIFIRAAIQDILGHEIHPPVAPGSSAVQQRDSSGRIAVVGSCIICRDLKQKRRKTRKACSVCHTAVCDEHSISKTICQNCN